jgi:hypothetical protein
VREMAREMAETETFANWVSKLGIEQRADV